MLSVRSAGYRALWAHAGIVLFVFAAAYWSRVGGGFLSDDFRWVLESRVREWEDLRRPFVDTTGFFRPLVALGVAAIEQCAGNNPRPYGIALFCLAAICSGSIAALARALGLTPGTSVLAGSLWLLNPHGINMSILWVSGLTALFLVLFCALAAIAVQRGRIALAVCFVVAALLSKEEAVLLPLPLLAIALARGTSKGKLLVLMLGCVIAEGLYFYLRSGSDAATPATAPIAYQFTFAPAAIAINALEYANRALTLSVVMIAGIWAVVRRRPRPEPVERRAIAIGLVWLAAGFGITVFLPIRSSLYVLLPSAGGVIAASALARAWWRAAGPRQRRALAAGALILPLCLLPILRSRAERWADLMRVTRATLEAVVPVLGDEEAVVFIDDRGRRDNLENAFRYLFPDAIELYTGRRPRIWLVPPPAIPGPGVPSPLPADLPLGWRYRNGIVETVDPKEFAGDPAVAIR